MAYEQPTYRVLQGADAFEVRQYAPYLIAETAVDGSFDEAGNEAFRRLAGYIFGKNRANRKIEMTVPVEQQPRSEKIAMTVPVGQERRGEQWVMSFMIPSRFTLETVPQPEDPRVTLREMPARKMAVVRFSGRGSAEQFEARKADLLHRVAEAGLQPRGEVVYARYNAPWTPWFLRRNEVLVEVA